MGCPVCERSGYPVVYANRAPQVPDGNDLLRGFCQSGFKPRTDYAIGERGISVDIFSTDFVKAAARVTELKSGGWDDSHMGPAWAQWWGLGRVSPKGECNQIGVTKPWHAVDGWLVIKRRSTGTPKPLPADVKKAPSGSIMTLNRGIPPIMIVETGIPGIPAQPAVYQYRSKRY